MIGIIQTNHLEVSVAYPKPGPIIGHPNEELLLELVVTIAGAVSRAMVTDPHRCSLPTDDLVRFLDVLITAWPELDDYAEIAALELIRLCKQVVVIIQEHAGEVKRRAEEIICSELENSIAPAA